MLAIICCLFTLIFYTMQNEIAYGEQAFDLILFLGACYFLLNFIRNLLSGEFLFKGLSVTREKDSTTFYLLTGIGFSIFLFFSAYFVIRFLN